MGYTTRQTSPLVKCCPTNLDTHHCRPQQELSVDILAECNYSAVVADLTMLCNGLENPRNYPFPWGICHLHLIHGSMAHPSPQPKRHHNQLIHFCRARGCDQQTHTTPLLKQHAASLHCEHAMWPNGNNNLQVVRGGPKKLYIFQHTIS